MGRLPVAPFMGTKTHHSDHYDEDDENDKNDEDGEDDEDDEDDHVGGGTIENSKGGQMQHL